MKVIILQCECEANLLLVVDRETGLFMGYCRECRRVYEMVERGVDAEELEGMRQRATPEVTEREDALFYLRCTDILR